MKVLTVGDGDFSFSVAVARIVNTKPESQQRVVATSYESEDTLRKCYPDFDLMVDELKFRGATIAYQVDATNIQPTLLSKVKEQTLPKFDRIIWNFPCTAVGKGQDGQNDAMEENKDLVRKFVRNARHHLSPTGELHVCHKTKPPFNQWNLEDVVALEACKESGCLSYHGRVVLDRATLPPYTPRKALDKKSFPCHDACIYVFGMQAARETSTIQPPQEKDAMNLSVGIHKRMIVPVDLAILAKVRKSLQAFAKGGKKKRGNKKQKRFA
jgi:25S rRNA (uracil2634-N3)-methyltransferase